MKPAPFADLLQRHADLVRQAGDERAAHGLEILSDGFHGSSAGSVSTALKKVQSGPETPAAAHLGGALDALAALLEAAGAKSPLADVRGLATAWRRSGGDAAAFAADLRKTTTKRAAAPKKPATPAIDAAEIADLGQRLKQAIGEPGRFAALLDAIVADKRIKKPALQKIAEHALGYPVGSLSAPKLVERLRDRPRLEAYQRSKRDIISKINV
ncbi:MAG: hypothetical protein AAFW46_06330 [Pseudomonadota bacterium]